MDIFLGVLFLIICFLLILVVLLQKGRGGGLGAAFGGMGSSAFGTKTGDVFTWVTIVLTGLFLLLAILSSLVFRPPSGTVDTPEFLPPPGPIREMTAVTISCDTPGAEIRYTIDGTEPTKNSAPYEEAAVKVRPGTTLKAKGFRPTWEPSETAVGLYPPADANALPPATAPTDANALPPATAPADANAPARPPATAPATKPATAPATRAAR
jgi:preprotein translocase subunit SecG